MRVFWMTLGLLSVALGMIGIFLPLLPTVPFILLAAFCFARSSERLHHWLVNHRHFGPVIIDWQERGAVSARAKRLATVSILAVFAISLALQVGVTVLIIQAVVLSAVLLFLWTRPNY